MFARSLGFVNPSVFTTVIPVTSNTNNIDVNKESLERGWNGSKRLRTFINVNSNTTVTSNTINKPAVEVNLRNNDFTLITNNGTIAGAPGSGGPGGKDGPGSPGQPGGDALVVNSPAQLINNGSIGAGGGGSGGAGGIRTPFSIFVGWAFSSCPQGSLNRGGGTCGVCAYTVRVRRGKGFANETRFVNANCRPVYNNGVTITRGLNGAPGGRGTASRGNFGLKNTYNGGPGGDPGNALRGRSFLLRFINNGNIAGQVLD